MPYNKTRNTLARQWELLNLLPTRGPGKTAKELAEALNEAGFAVSKRQVERDLGELCLGSQVLKGVADLTGVFRVLSPTVVTGVPFLVGRDEAMGLLVWRWGAPRVRCPGAGAEMPFVFPIRHPHSLDTWGNRGQRKCPFPHAPGQNQCPLPP